MSNTVLRPCCDHCDQPCLITDLISTTETKFYCKDHQLIDDKPFNQAEAFVLLARIMPERRKLRLCYYCGKESHSSVIGIFYQETYLCEKHSHLAINFG